MSTNKSTFSASDFVMLYGALKKGAKKDKFMFRIFYDVLEHDLKTSKKKAKQSSKHFKAIRKRIKRFGREWEKTMEVMMQATKNSDKY